MIRLRSSLIAWSILTGCLALLAGCEEDLEPVRLPGEVTFENAYVGAEACRSCHQAEYAVFKTSGHGYKLNRVSGAPPIYPYSAVQNPPAGYDWDDILYVIGGFGWKARFIDRQGYIITGNAVQWNLETSQWVAYEASAVNKPYDCGPCHTTGYHPAGNQLGLPGLIGTWAEDGITCEACHGPGGQHVLSRQARHIVVDRRSERCGECHTRDAQRRIQASGGFIQHHEQYDEMIAAGHRNLTCVSCHDPHASTKYNPAQGVVLDCQTCHGGIEVYNVGDGAHTCVNCHMPFATRTAVTRGQFTGDVRTHIFRINADPDAPQFYQEDGKTFSHGYLTTDFACLACHTGRDRQWAASYAGTIHSAGKGGALLAGR